MNMKIASTIILSAMFFISACDDQGNIVSTPITPSNAPTIVSLSPDSGSVGDTITIKGSKFGSAQGSSTISFGSVAATPIGTWSDTLIKTIVPVNAVTGNVIVKVNGLSSAGKQFKVLGTVPAVSFINDIRPLITSYGCAGCHPANGGFSVATHATIITRVTTGNGNGSLLVQKLRGTSGTRMPQGGPYMSPSEIQKFVDWIDQGALEN